jgi:hypothetical protein
MRRQPLYGLLAEFESPEALLEAANKTRAAGYKRVDAFTPLPVEGLAEAVGFHHTKLPLVVLIGGVLGGIAGFAMQYYASVVSYPLIVAGRPLNSWPSFIPITFELTILGAAVACVFGMLAMNGLPTPYHPIFNVPRFALATRDRFFLLIKARDQQFDAVKTKQFMTELHAREVSEVEA